MKQYILIFLLSCFTFVHAMDISSDMNKAKLAEAIGQYNVQAVNQLLVQANFDVEFLQIWLSTVESSIISGNIKEAHAISKALQNQINKSKK